jgi:response regulator RpfG family c-di-GMP phosphodiesterase
LPDDLENLDRFSVSVSRSSAHLLGRRRYMGKARIMVVEDERITAEIIKIALQKLGYSVSSVVASGEQAIIKAKEERPDLILMDIVLQGEMDGIEAAQQIRLQNNIPVIYLSSYSEEELIQRAKVTEPYAYILKPFNERELHINIEISLYRHQLEQELKRAYTKLQKTLRGTIGAMSTIAEIGDPFLTGHQQRTAQLACAIANQMDLEKNQIETIWLASVIHDIGLISIPFELFHKLDTSLKKGSKILFFQHHPVTGKLFIRGRIIRMIETFLAAFTDGV